MADAEMGAVRGGLEAVCGRLDALRGDLDGVMEGFVGHLRDDLGLDMGGQSGRADLRAVLEAMNDLDSAHGALSRAVDLIGEEVSDG